MRLAAEKSQPARRRVIEALGFLQQSGAVINFNTICQAANVSKTFLYDPKHADLAQQIRAQCQAPPQPPPFSRATPGKSDSAKDAQIARFKERIHVLEERARDLQHENELLYGKLATRQDR